eukprot:3404305-Pyramimonas_sp.AAC.1
MYVCVCVCNHPTLAPKSARRPPLAAGGCVGGRGTPPEARVAPTLAQDGGQIFHHHYLIGGTRAITRAGGEPPSSSCAPLDGRARGPVSPALQCLWGRASAAPPCLSLRAARTVAPPCLA